MPRPCPECDVDMVVEFLTKCEDPAKVSLIFKAAEARLHELAHRDATGAGRCTRDTARRYQVPIPGYEGPQP